MDLYLSVSLGKVLLYFCLSTYDGKMANHYNKDYDIYIMSEERIIESKGFHRCIKEVVDGQ